jgi:nitroreductase
VARLLPSPRDPLLLASVGLAGPYQPRPAERDLYAAIRRRGSRGPFPGHPLPRGLALALREAAALEGALLHELGQADALRILRSCAAADPDLRADPGYLAGLAARASGSRYGGHSQSGGGGQARPPGKRVTGGLLTMRDFSPGQGGRPSPAVSGASPQLAIISTRADDRASWLRAGQAAQHVLLLAAHRGLRAGLLSPALEPPGAPASGEPVLDGGHPAVILQFGSGCQQPATARRPVAQVLRVVPPVSGQQPAAPGRHKVTAGR